LILQYVLARKAQFRKNTIVTLLDGVEQRLIGKEKRRIR